MPVNASIYNTTGCLTVRFVSDGSAEASGWSAEISCEPQCQEVIAHLNANLTSPSPDTNYIAICPGDQITFSGYGEYPQNDYVYHHDDNTSNFEWHFGDGTTATGQTVTHTYNESGGYNITLFITDQNGCTSRNSIGTRVITAGNPFETVINPPAICAGDTLKMLFSDPADPNLTIGGDPYHVQMDASLGVSDTTFLPDGTGVTYTTSVVFNCFAPGQTLHNAWDIISLCANMEHSFLGDLEIKLICPNGQSIILKEYPNGGGTYLGVPIDDGSITPGTGWDYCWSPSPTYGTMVAESASYSTLPAGSYTPFESFAGLVGCPLNGQWTIEVSDNWAADNGYIFSWELSLDPSISPDNWSYTVPIVQQGWTSGPYIINSTQESITVTPPSPGTYEYVYTIVDAVGCTWDTSAFLTVIPNPAVDLGPDINFCNTISVVTLDAGNPGFTYLWNDGSTAQTLLAGISGTYSVTVTNGQCSEVDSINVYYGQISTVATVTDASCYDAADGMINLTTTANSPPLNYMWSNGAITEDLINVVAGSYTVSIIDMYGCMISENIVIDEPDQVVISASQDVWICMGEDVVLNASATGGMPGYIFEWSNGQGGTDIQVAPLSTQTYYVYATDINGCLSNTEEVIVNVYDPISVNVDASLYEVCIGDPVILTTNASGGNGNYTYTLQNNADVINSVHTVYPGQTMTYTIMVSDDCGSPTDEASVNIKVNQLPAITFMPDTTQGCEPLTVSFVEINQDVGQTYLWDFGDMNSYNTSDTKNPVHIYEEPGIYTVSLTVTSPEGCKNTEVVSDLIRVFAVPDAGFVSQPGIATVIKPIIYFENITTGGIEYRWFFGDGDSSHASNPYHTYASETGTYMVELIAESEHACKDTVYSEVRIKDEYSFFAPNAFSPDNDGINDDFFVTGNSIDENSFNMIIFDRWGEVIYESDNLYEKWDGTVNGGTRICKIGTYTWLAIFKDSQGIEHQESGAVTIIR